MEMLKGVLTISKYKMVCAICGLGMWSHNQTSPRIENTFSGDHPTIACIVSQSIYQSRFYTLRLDNFGNDHVSPLDVHPMNQNGAQPPPIVNVPDHPGRHMDNTIYIQNSFSPHEITASNELSRILSTNWWFANAREPRSTFDQLIERQDATFLCKFLSCGHKEFARLDRVKAHIRWHLALRPFVCLGTQVVPGNPGCGVAGWYALFLILSFSSNFVMQPSALKGFLVKSTSRHTQSEQKLYVPTGNRPSFRLPLLDSNLRKVAQESIARILPAIKEARNVILTTDLKLDNSRYRVRLRREILTFYRLLGITVITSIGRNIPYHPRMKQANQPGLYPINLMSTGTTDLFTHQRRAVAQRYVVRVRFACVKMHCEMIRQLLLAYL